MHQYRLGADLLESSSVEKDLGDLVYNKLSISQQYALVARKANGTLRCIRKIPASRLRQMILLLMWEGYRIEFCEKLPEASPVFDRANANWLQEASTAGQGQDHQQQLKFLKSTYTYVVLHSDMALDKQKIVVA
ncbi:hypothetical protein WISP_45791 [Willisornis vidua]|uniref:Uncharacterized protein n=1 Tax=Willisornis vidua TaxID=1566151 RepID=A0ABQ9DL50_9PASS|nr:hypothetical protein WISP_45791 [Willisornis vidua]